MKNLIQIQDAFIAALKRPNAYKTIALARSRAHKALRAWGYSDEQIHTIMNDARDMYLLDKNAGGAR